MVSARRKTLPAESRAQRLRGQVTELSWNAFMKRHVHAHLLMGSFNPDETLMQGNRLVLLRGLARACCTRGNYAVTILQNVEGGDLAMVAAEHREDADRISRIIHGRMAPRFDPWYSHRSFNIGAAAYRRIAVALARRLTLGRIRSRPSLPRPSER
jgi:hypothetical protein